MTSAQRNTSRLRSFRSRLAAGSARVFFPGLVRCVAVLSLVVGCGGQAPVATVPPPPSSAPPPEAPRASVDLLGEDWGEVESPEYPLVVRLPQARAWQVDDAERNWLELTHSRSSSSVRIRSWRAGRRARPVDCREQASLWVPAIRELTEDQRVAEHDLSVPEGFITHVELFAVPLSAPDELLEVEGRVLAFGAAPMRCIAVLFSTRARGTGADRVVAERLGLWADDALPHLRMRGIADRVRPEPLAPPRGTAAPSLSGP